LAIAPVEPTAAPTGGAFDHVSPRSRQHGASTALTDVGEAEVLRANSRSVAFFTLVESRGTPKRR
jgi:hypothetical protein